MKKFLFLSAIATIILSSSECNSKNFTANILKGRLEIKGICLNYTIKLMQGTIDTSKFSTAWTDPNTKILHTNVFRLSDPCSFPETIEQGDEFNFIIDTTESTPCMVCEAYYPTPSRALRIKVLNK